MNNKTKTGRKKLRAAGVFHSQRLGSKIIMAILTKTWLHSCCATLQSALFPKLLLLEKVRRSPEAMGHTGPGGREPRGGPGGRGFGTHVQTSPVPGGGGDHHTHTDQSGGAGTSTV